MLTDALALGADERGHELGAGAARHPAAPAGLHCAGEVELEVEYAPRPEYGLIHPLLTPVPGGITARGGADRLFLSAAGPLRRRRRGRDRPASRCPRGR